MSNDKGNPWDNDYSFRYNAMIHILHSFFQATRNKFVETDKLSIDKTIKEFKDSNEDVIRPIVLLVEGYFDYELSHNQVCIALTMLTGTFVKDNHGGCL